MVTDKLNVLVTGATGFIGQYVVSRLLAIENIHVTATARTYPSIERASWLPNVTFRPFDMTTDSTRLNLFDYFNKPDAVIHLAWSGLPDYKSMVHLDTYWLQQYRFLTNLISNGLSNLTVTGTCLEYGLQSGCLSERTPAQPTTAYGLAKDTLRKTLELFVSNQNVSVKWLRLFYMYGKGQNPKSLLPQVEAAALRGDQVFNMSKGEQLRDYLSVENVADSIVKSALQQHVNGIINCCSGQPISVRTLVENFLQINRYTLKLNLGYYSYPDYEPLAFWGDNHKLQTLLAR